MKLRLLFLFMLAVAVSYGQDTQQQPTQPEQPKVTLLGDVQVELITRIVPLDPPGTVTVLVDNEGNAITEVKPGTVGTVRVDTIYERPVAAYNLFYYNAEGKKVYISQIPIER